MKKKESFLVKGENESFGVDLSRVDIDFLKEVQANQDSISRGIEDVVQFYTRYAIEGFYEKIQASDFYQDGGVKKEATSFISQLTSLVDKTIKPDEADTGSIDSLKEKLAELKVYAEYLYLLHFIKPGEEINKKTVEQAAERKRESEGYLSGLLDNGGLFFMDFSGLTSGIFNHKNFDEYFKSLKRPKLKERYTRIVSKYSIEEINHKKELMMSYKKQRGITNKDLFSDFKKFVILHDNLFFLESIQDTVYLVSIKQEFEKEKRELESVEASREEVTPKKEETEEKPLETEQVVEEDVHKVAHRKVKEPINLVYFYWFFKDGKSIKEAVGEEDLKEMFEKIKEIQGFTHRKIVLAILSDVGEEEGRKLLQELKDEAVRNNLSEENVNGIAIGVGRKYITEDGVIDLTKEDMDISYQDKRLRNNIKGIKKEPSDDSRLMIYNLDGVSEEDLDSEKMYRAISKNSRLVSIYLDSDGRRAYMVSDARSPRFTRLLLERELSKDYIIVPNSRIVKEENIQEEQK